LFFPEKVGNADHVSWGSMKGGWPMPMNESYDDLGKRILALCAGEADQVALMATIACEVYAADDRFDWVGFYRNIGDRMLKIGPFQGGHGCLTIPFGKGVCGAVADSQAALNVPDVDAFSSHIACSTSTRSELVLPVFNRDGSLIAVFDIDSDQPAAFLPEDQHRLQSILNAVFGQLP
jgi:L-methionine (R)-S-oxide reductase